MLPRKNGAWMVLGKRLREHREAAHPDEYPTEPRSKAQRRLLEQAATAGLEGKAEVELVGAGQRAAAKALERAGRGRFELRVRPGLVHAAWFVANADSTGAVRR